MLRLTRRKFGFRNFIIMALIPTVYAGGCSSSSLEGEILIGRPEVFTRQRLVNRRLTEQQWLEAQLASSPTTSTFQGFQDVRTFEGFYNKTGVTVDPLAGRLSVAQNNLNVQNLQNQIETNALQQQIDKLKLQQQLDALRNPANSAGTAAASSTPSSSATAGSSSPVNSLRFSWCRCSNG